MNDMRPLKEMTPPVDAVSHAPAKAGLVVFERGDRRAGKRMQLLMGLSDRYGDGHVFPNLCKGKIDAGESVLAAAVREAKEETRFDLPTLLGEEAWSRLQRGEAIGPMDSPGYKGVRIVSVDPAKAVHHEYTSSKGKPIPLVLYTVEVENLNALAPQLKGAPASLNIKDWENPELIAARLGLPNAEQRLDMLRTGIVPPQANVAWADAENTQVLFHDPLLPRMEAMLGINASTLPGLEQCMHELEMRSYREQSEGVVGGMSCLLAGIEAQLAAIKTHLENTKLIGDGDAPLKMDVLDRPLRAYQEKAMIGAPATFLEHAWQQKKRFTLYDESMWGGRGKENTALSDEERLYTAQMEALTKFLRSVDPMEIGFAASEIKRYKPGKRPKGDVSGLAALADEPPSPWGERVAMPLTARNR